MTPLLLLWSLAAFASDDWTAARVEEDPNIVVVSKTASENDRPVAIMTERNSRFMAIFFREPGMRDLWHFLDQPKAEAAADSACRDREAINKISAFKILDPARLVAVSGPDDQEEVNPEELAAAAEESWKSLSLSQKILSVMFGSFLHFKIRENADAPNGFEITSAIVSCRDTAGKRVQKAALRGLASVLSLSIVRFARITMRAKDMPLMLAGLRQVANHAKRLETYLDSPEFDIETAHLNQPVVQKNVEVIKKTHDIIRDSIKKLQAKHKPKGRSIASTQIGLTGAQINKLTLFYR